MSVQKITDYKHFAAFLRIMVHSLDRYKHPVAVRMRTDGRVRCSTVQKCHVLGRVKDVFGCGGQIREQYRLFFVRSSAPKGRSAYTFAAFCSLRCHGGQISVHFCHFLFSQVPRRTGECRRWAVRFLRGPGRLFRSRRRGRATSGRGPPRREGRRRWPPRRRRSSRGRGGRPYSRSLCRR